MGNVSKVILEHACRIAGEIGAKAVLMYAAVADDLPVIDDPGLCMNIILVTKGDEEIPSKFKDCGVLIQVPNVNLTRVGQIKIAITKGIALGLFTQGDKLVCVSGVPRFGYVDSIFVIDVGKEFEILVSGNFSDLAHGVYPEVFGAVMNLAIELAAQGREGRKVGTIFVLGDHEKVMQLSRQMIINPFMGYTDEQRNILNPELKETIKEFSAIDGAFIVKDNGTIVTAGRHLSAAMDSRDLAAGISPPRGSPVLPMPLPSFYPNRRETSVFLRVVKSSSTSKNRSINGRHYEI
jgi:diadenylate cyclase